MYFANTHNLFVSSLAYIKDYAFEMRSTDFKVT
jgi:hypothetical protein